MAQVYFIKTLSELLVPFIREAFEYIQTIKTGCWHKHNVRQTSNCLFHKSYFCLLKCGYGHSKQTGGLKGRRTAAGVYGMSRKLTDAAPGHNYQMRIPDVCNFISETVLAHYRLADPCDTDLKPDDEPGDRVCSVCHRVVDGRICDNFTREELRLFQAEDASREQALVREEAK